MKTYNSSAFGLLSIFLKKKFIRGQSPFGAPSKGPRRVKSAGLAASHTSGKPPVEVRERTHVPMPQEPTYLFIYWIYLS